MKLRKDAMQKALRGSSSVCLSCRLGLLLPRPRHSVPQNVVRSFHNSRSHRDSVSSGQAQPLGDYYADLLATPIPKTSQVNRNIPTFVQSGDATKEERAARLFGTIKGSGYERRISDTPDATWRTINGVPIPPRPAEPDNCCMSGCVHCVWDDFRDDVESWAMRLREAQAKAHGGGTMESPKVGMHRNEVATASSSMDDDGGGSEGLWDAPSGVADEGEELFQGIPIGIREFMATEKRIRDRKKARKRADKSDANFEFG